MRAAAGRGRGIGLLPAVYIGVAAAYRNLANTAHNTALIMIDHYNAATTTYLQNLATVVRHAETAIDNPGAAGGHAVNAGNAAQAAVAAINGISVPNAAAVVAAAAAPIAAAQGGGALNGAPGVALAKNARDAALPGSGARPTGPAGYRSQAFDHLLTTVQIKSPMPRFATWFQR